MRRRWTWWLAWGLWALFVAAIATTITLDEYTVGPSEAGESFGSDLSLVLAFSAFATVGALVASREPRNAVGWLFLASPLFGSFAALSQEYAYRALVFDPGSLPFGLVAGWLYLWTWYPAVGSIGLLPLLFPNGRPPSPRWRPVVWAFGVVIASITLAFCVYPGPLDDTEGEVWPDNPLGVTLLKPYLDATSAVVGVSFLLLVGASVASTIVRFRHSSGDERQQLKWMVMAVSVVAVSQLPEAFGVEIEILFGLAVATIPIAAGIAMLKYRLYDIDVVIRKGLVYGPLTVVLGVVYAAVVVAAQAILRPLTGGSDLAIAVSTLIVAALFLPFRGRVQRLVDRRFYRRRYDAQRTLETFGARLRQEIELEQLTGDLGSAVAETMQPTHVSFWLRTESGS